MKVPDLPYEMLLFHDQGCKYLYIFISRSYIRSETRPDLTWKQCGQTKQNKN